MDSRTTVALVAFNKISTDARSYNFARTLLELNFNIVAVAKDETPPRFNSKNFHFIGIKAKQKGRTIFRLIDFYLKAIRKVRKIKADFVLACDVYSLPIAKCIARTNNCKIIYDSREIYSELASLSDKKLKKKIIAKFEKHYLKFVEKIIVTGELDKEYLRKIFPNHHYFIIKNFPPRFDSANRIDLRKILNLPNDSIILVYQGMLLKGRGLEKVVHALRFDQRLHLICFGEGEYLNLLKETAEAENVSKQFHHLGSKPYWELLEWTSGGDIGLSLIEPISLSYELALPNKLFEYFMAGLPVVASNLPAIRKVYEKYQFGAIVEPNIAPFELARIFATIFNQKEKYSDTIQNARNEFCWENQVATIMQLFK